MLRARPSDSAAAKRIDARSHWQRRNGTAVETAEGAAADADMANDDEEAGAGEAAAAAAVAVEAAEKRAAGAGDLLLAMLGE